MADEQEGRNAARVLDTLTAPQIAALDQVAGGGVVVEERGLNFGTVCFKRKRDVRGVRRQTLEALVKLGVLVNIALPGNMVTFPPRLTDLGVSVFAQLTARRS